MVSFYLCTGSPRTFTGPWVLVPVRKWSLRAAPGLAGRVGIEVSESRSACPLTGLKEVSFNKLRAVKGPVRDPALQTRLIRLAVAILGELRGGMVLLAS
jgi:hypothetical protein